MELMEALIPLKVRWSTLFSSHYCLDEKFMDLAAKSGLLHVNTGIESIHQHTLATMHKNFNKASEYGHMIRNLTKRDISYPSTSFSDRMPTMRPCLTPHSAFSTNTRRRPPISIFSSPDAAPPFTRNSTTKAG
jgi:hypothetical protein